MFQQIGTPTFTMPHSAAAWVLDTNYTRRKIEFQSYVISMQLRMASLTKSPKSTFSIVITMFPSTVWISLHSKSEAPQLSDSKHMLNADSNMKSFLVSTECSAAHPVEDLITVVPLVQTLQDDSSPISTRPLDMQGDWFFSFFEKWERVQKVNSFTDEGKMVWAKACGLEEEFKVLLS